jgi:hypothetical protein
LFVEKVSAWPIFPLPERLPAPVAAPATKVPEFPFPLESISPVACAPLVAS